MNLEQRILIEDLRSAYHIARNLSNALETCEQNYIKLSGNSSPEFDEVLADIEKAKHGLTKDWYFIKCALETLCEKDIEEATEMLRFTLLGEDFRQTVADKISSEE